MGKFINFPHKIVTFGDALNPYFNKIETKVNAIMYFNSYVKYMIDEHDLSRSESIKSCLKNIRYIGGIKQYVGAIVPDVEGAVDLIREFFL